MRIRRKTNTNYEFIKLTHTSCRNIKRSKSSSSPGTDKIGVKISYLSLEDLQGANTKNVLACTKNSVKSVLDSEDFVAKLVGFGSDGASVNAGKKESVKTLIRDENPWVIIG